MSEFDRWHQQADMRQQKMCDGKAGPGGSYVSVPHVNEGTDLTTTPLANPEHQNNLACYFDSLDKLIQTE